MLQVVLYSNQSRHDNWSAPLWEPLTTSEDVTTAFCVFRRAVAKCNCTQILWVEVTKDNLIGLRGYLDVAAGIDHEAACYAAGEAAEAAEAIMDEVRRHRSVVEGQKRATA